MTFVTRLFFGFPVTCKVIPNVEVDKVLSSPLDITSAILQGPILGPLLFMLYMYINDCPLVFVSHKFCCMQMIQCYFFATKTAIELKASLNTDINRISSWMQENIKLFLNISKTEYVIYGLHQRLKKEDSVILSCNGSRLMESDSFK